MPHSTTYSANANAILPSFVETALVMLPYPGTCNWSVRGDYGFLLFIGIAPQSNMETP